MATERDRPEGRLVRILTPTPHQVRHRLSAFERRIAGREIDPWRRGLYFTWIWEELGRKWHWYEQVWFFRGTREWWLLYVPFFWRSGSEFLAFEKRFIDEATEAKGTMSQQEFIRRAEAYKSQLQLGAIQGPLVGAMAAGGGIAAIAGGVLDKINRIESYQDMVACGMREEGYEEACVKAVNSVLNNMVKKKLSQ